MALGVPMQLGCLMLAVLCCSATAAAPASVQQSPASTAGGRSLPTTRWQCAYMPGKWQNRFFRLNNGNPECASLDGIRCLYNTEAAAPNCAPYIFAPKLDQLKLKPLACGKAHAKVWNGNTGFSEKGHWCNSVKAYFDTLLKKYVSNLPPGGACLGNTDCLSGLCLPKQPNSKARLCGCKADKDCGRVSYCSPSKRQCLPKQTPNNNCPCGKQATEDYDGYKGSCIGKQCFMCTAPETLNYARAGPGDVATTVAFPYFCDLKNYTYKATVLDVAPYQASGTETTLGYGILVG